MTLLPPIIPILLLAAITTGIVTGFCAPLIVWARERRFKIKETDNPETDRFAIAATFCIPKIDAAQAAISGRINQFKAELTKVHERTNRLQSEYHSRVARCVSCLALALGVLGLSSTILHNNKTFELYAAAVEVVAFIVAFEQWWAARLS